MYRARCLAELRRETDITAALRHYDEQFLEATLAEDEQVFHEQLAWEEEDYIRYLIQLSETPHRIISDELELEERGGLMDLDTENMRPFWSATRCGRRRGWWSRRLL